MKHSLSYLKFLILAIACCWVPSIYSALENETNGSNSIGWIVGGSLAPTILLGTHYGVFSGYRFSRNFSLELRDRAMGRSVGPNGGNGREYFRTIDISAKLGIFDFFALKVGVGSSQKETNNYLFDNSSSTGSISGSSRSILRIAHFALGTGFIDARGPTSSTSFIGGIDYLFFDYPIQMVESSGTDKNYAAQAKSRHSKVEFGFANLFCGLQF